MDFAVALVNVVEVTATPPLAIFNCVVAASYNSNDIGAPLAVVIAVIGERTVGACAYMSTMTRNTVYIDRW
jgi:hypothetical protein